MLLLLEILLFLGEDLFSMVALAEIWLWINHVSAFIKRKIVRGENWYEKRRGGLLILSLTDYGSLEKMPMEEYI
jgi:hypothetical protein